MEKSETITKLALALVAFQKDMGAVSFDANNPFFQNKYATLAALVAHAKPLLASNKLAVSQLTEGEGGVTTILMHESGEYMFSTLTLKPSKDDPQGRGSAITYARRYGYASILGLVSDDDDDGNAATATAETAKPASKPAAKKPLTKAEAYAAAKKRIAEATTADQLLALTDRVDESDKFTEPQKRELKGIISARTDQIDIGVDTIN